MLTYIVPNDLDGMILQDALRRGMRLSDRLLRGIKKTPGAIRVNGAKMYTNQRVYVGMTITVALPEEKTALRREETKIEIIYQDDWLLCVNKPAGIVCHPTRGLAPGEETMLERVAGYLGFVPHPVHRLDKETSGLLLYAKNGYAQSNLKDIKKEYEAVCFGVPEKAQGDITLPILAYEGSARRVIDPTGKSAHTHYQVVRRGAQLALLRLRIYSGRTHQIRVHMAAMGSPILGDMLYGTEESVAYSQAMGVERMMLHACMLQFEHPVTGEQIMLECACQTFPTVMMQ